MDKAKKKIFMLIGAAILIFPTVIALISLIHAKVDPVTVNSVSHVTIISPDGNQTDFSRTDKDSEMIIDRFLSLTENSSKVSKLPSQDSSYGKYNVEFTSYNKKNKYVFYMTKSDENAYYSDENGDFYRISKKNASEFLLTDSAVYLYEDAVYPHLSIGNRENVLPVNGTWYYIGYENKKFEAPRQYADDSDTVCTVSGDLEVMFDKEPDFLNVVIYENNKVIYDGTYSEIDSTLFGSNKRYKVEMHAIWYESENRIYNGELFYGFIANVQSPAVFYLSTSETEYGNFFVISAKNVTSPEQIGFTSSPSIGFEPKFFEYGGFYHALVPLSAECLKLNDGARKYTFTLTYGGVTQNLNIDVNKAEWERSDYKAYISTSEETLNRLRSGTALMEFEDTMKEPLSSSSETIYWIDDKFVTTPVANKKIKFGYGIQMILQNLNGAPSYLHEGVDYSVASNDEVRACLSGQVIYVGETTYSGKTVIIDHGAGLKSMYAHLSSINCDVGDIVSNGTMIGVVGDTGMCYKRPTVHFGLYVYNVPVRYYDYETDGILLSEAVMKELEYR